MRQGDGERRLVAEMRKIWKFAKIDLLKARRYYWLLLFPVIAALLMLRDDGAGREVFGVTYSLFGGIVLGSLPFQNGNQEGTGFQRMLPARDGDQTRGHYLFALLALCTFFVFEIGVAAVISLGAPGVRVTQNGLYLVCLAVAVLFSGVQLMLLTLLDGNNLLVAQLMRLGPAFLYFFGSTVLPGTLPNLVARFLSWLRLPWGLLICILCVGIYILLCELCVVLERRRLA